MSKIFDAIRQNGFVLIRDALPPPSTFIEVYKAFDGVAKLMATDELASIILEKTAIDWAKDLRRSGFLARAPMGFRDRSIRPDKAKKSYFQYASGYGAFVRANYPRLFSTYPEVDWLFANCEILSEAAVTILRPVILEFERRYPGLRRLLIREQGFPPVVVRLIRYEPGSEIESMPHHDKSAFTIHMNSDDATADQFVIGPWRRELELSDLKPIMSRANLRRTSDAVVFPGMFLGQMGYEEILPSPHAALGSKDARLRHVAVGFWLIPFMFTDHLSTNIPLRGVA
jgi:hypothetical protein